MLLKEFLPNITEPEYRKLDAINYSLLKALCEKGPRVIIEPSPEISGDGVTLGSIVDRRLSDESYMVESEYFISDIALNLSGDNHLSKILVFLKNNPEVVLEKGDMEMFNRLCTILEFKRFPTPDDDFWGQVALVNKISSGVKVLSSYELELSNIMVNTFITHPYTSSIFNPELGVETLNQVVVTVQIDGVPCKILIDKLLVNHNTKQLFVYDIKTGSVSDFMKNFFGYKYYYQGSFYYTVLKQFLLSIPELSEYTIIDGFNFIYVSREDPYRPFIYNMDTNYIQYVYNGYETISGVKIKGIKELLDDYSWYKANEIYDTVREIYENKGVISIKTPNIWKNQN